ncbi:hypothetical protein [Kutzneria albida]|uniref:Uncharacterized protein n=1 Tax=Kutzneria albida DSM 43870 TaxID=1449976 RepID=W5W9E0_9PSEU|nr:hypothetical protein [Kutzneria albida]AHH94814.1 hypothetical protein KALB_1441 [Kutzneria albida DSM 43870]
MGSLLLKFLLTPTLIVLASLVQRRWGLVGLPLTSAPLLLALTLDEGPEFAVRTATATLGGQLCVAAFCLGYARTGARHGWPLALGVACCCFAITALALHLVELPLVLLVALVPLGLSTALLAWPLVPADETLPTGPAWELVARVLVAVSFLLLITESAALLGSRVAGLIAPFPVFVSLLTICTHRGVGPSAALGVLRAAVTSAFSGAVFFLTVLLALPALGTAWAFGLALVVTVLAHLLVGPFTSGSKAAGSCIGRMTRPELASRS